MKGLLGLVVIVVVIVAIFKGCGSSGDSSGGSMDQTTKDFMVYDACTDAVSQQLKAPSSADFQGETSVDYSTNGSSVVIVGWVDADNSFGAKLRNDWSCSADVDDSGNVTDVQATVSGG